MNHLRITETQILEIIHSKGVEQQVQTILNQMEVQHLILCRKRYY